MKRHRCNGPAFKHGCLRCTGACGRADISTRRRWSSGWSTSLAYSRSVVGTQCLPATALPRLSELTDAHHACGLRCTYRPGLNPTYQVKGGVHAYPGVGAHKWLLLNSFKAFDVHRSAGAQSQESRAAAPEQGPEVEHPLLYPLDHLGLFHLRPELCYLRLPQPGCNSQQAPVHAAVQYRTGTRPGRRRGECWQKTTPCRQEDAGNLGDTASTQIPVMSSLRETILVLDTLKLAECGPS